MSPDLDPSDGLPTRAAVARELLRYKMEEYSEDFHCASWLSDLEYLLWSVPSEEESPSGRVRRDISNELHILGEIAGGWWVYEDETRPSERGPVFVSMDRWQQILAQHQHSGAP